MGKKLILSLKNYLDQNLMDPTVELCFLGHPLLAEQLVTKNYFQRISINPEKLNHTDACFIQARHDKLPVPSESMDKVFLVHSLELIMNPHEVLREAYRILKPEGMVVIVGFNPWSLWGICKFFYNLFNKKKYPWNASFISITRIKDWLCLLMFDNLIINTIFYKFPILNFPILKNINTRSKLGSYLFPYSGGIYIIQAYKKVITLTPIRPIIIEPENTLAKEALVRPI